VRGARVPKDGLLVREVRAVVWRLAAIPGVPLNEACLAVLNPLRARREGVAPDVDNLPCDGVDRSANPDPVPSRLDLEVVFTAIHAVPLDAARYPGAAVGTRAAVRIGRGGARNEAREDTVKDGLPATVGAWLNTGVSEAGAYEIELLCEVVARDMLCLDVWVY